MLERIQVEEGFLDSLDLRFERGLNVLIGPRGTGKTSIIELIRFCLAVPGYTEKSQAIAKQHALSILGDGRVTVTLRLRDEQFSVSRSATEEVPKALVFRKPVILSQNEIESVGLEAKGKIRIIDSFRQGKGVQETKEQTLLSYVNSLTLEIQSISQEIQNLKEQFEQLATVPQDLLDAQAQEKQFLNSIAKTKGEQDKLQMIGRSLAALSVEEPFSREVHWLLKSGGQGFVSCNRFRPNLSSGRSLQIRKMH